MPKYKVTVYHEIGSTIVEADSKEEAMEIIRGRQGRKDKLIELFNLGYSANLQVKATKIEE